MQRKVLFNDGYYFHIFNRGVDRREVFLDVWDFKRFLISLRKFNTTKTEGGLYRMFLKEREINRGSTSKLEVEPRDEQLVEFICFNLMPNHFHFILIQLKDDGIVKFMHKISTAYTMYFNRKYNRSGSLFQGKFKSAHINSEQQLSWMSAYVNCNAEIHGIAKSEDWIWSSYLDFTGKRTGTLCNKQVVMKDFSSVVEYINYCKDVVKEVKTTRKELKGILE